MEGVTIEYPVNPKECHDYSLIELAECTFSVCVCVWAFDCVCFYLCVCVSLRFRYLAFLH